MLLVRSQGSGPDYGKGVIGAAVWYLLGLVYFAAYARKNLVKAPAEAFAIREWANKKRQASNPR